MFKRYVALQDFSVSLNEAKDYIEIKVGDIVEYDGLTVKCHDKEGESKSLIRTITGNDPWLTEESSVQNVKGKTTKKSALNSRNATGGRIFENSDYTSDPNTKKNHKDDSLDTLVKEFDKKVVNDENRVTSDLSDAKREVKIIKEEDTVVRKVSAKEETIKNNSGVEISNIEDKKRTVISQDNVVVKNTSSGNKAAKDSSKKLKVDMDSEGVVYKSTTYTNTKEKTDVSKVEVIESEVDVGAVSHPATKTTDIGSSTQVSVEKSKDAAIKPEKKNTQIKKSVLSKGGSPLKKSIIAKKAEVPKVAPKVVPKEVSKEAIKKEVIDVNGQEAVVYGKVTKPKSKVTIEDGIRSSVSVGVTDEGSFGEVTFSGNNDEIDTSVTFSSSEDTVTDISEGTAKIIPSDDGIDINDLLGDN